MRVGFARLAAAGILVAWPALADPPIRNGFALDPRDFDASEIVEGGPPRDGIPALDHPESVAADASPWDDDELVLGVVANGEARAYPLALLAWHELVNDTLGGRPILVSYCPLCGTGMVFDRRPGGAGFPARSFGVSGLLYRSGLLLYDRETGSLWSQIAATAVTGPSQGERLQQVRSRVLPWGRFHAEHPGARVLSRNSGHARDYARDPYAGYAHSESLLFPVAVDPRYHPKMPTLGLRLPRGEARGYPAVELVRAGGRVDDSFAGQRVSVAYDPEGQTFDIRVPDEVEVVEGYWFAWAAFHPKASLFMHPAEGGDGAVPVPTPAP